MIHVSQLSYTGLLAWRAAALTQLEESLLHEVTYRLASVISMNLAFITPH